MKNKNCHHFFIDQTYKILKNKNYKKEKKIINRFSFDDLQNEFKICLMLINQLAEIPFIEIDQINSFFKKIKKKF